MCGGGRRTIEASPTDSKDAMELLPQSREALDEYVTTAVDDVEVLLRVIEGWAVRTVPECVALSVTLLEDDLTFTLVDDTATTRPADAGGQGSADATGDAHALDEGEWAEMARERAFAGILSTVLLPVVEHGRAVLTIDLYASTPHAFHDRIEGLVEALGGWQAGAVTNADLGFETLRRAEAAPERLREQRVLDVAIGVVAARLGLTTSDADELLTRAAERAGVSAVQAATVAQALLA
jgi:GAF domain-containing protein